MSLWRKWNVRLHGRASFAALKARAGLPLGVVDRMALLATSLAEWRAAKFALAARKQVERRRAICESRPCWRRRPVPHCSVCGCSSAKLWLPTAKCPRGHW